MSECESNILKRFDSEIDIYKTHLDIVIKAALFVFGITGAVVSFVLTKVKLSNLAEMSLWVPILLNGGFAMIYGMSITRANTAFEKHKQTCRKLKIEHLDMSPLTGVCVVLCLMCVITSVGSLC